jgi:O-acetyl-ADP-ribose deacetylase (regulator of RNase III)
MFSQKPMMTNEDKRQIRIVQGDITQQKTAAIVNAANEAMLGGGGVDGAIHRAAGPELLAECRTIGGCPTGQARITKGYNLSARYVIHTVGPIWRGGKSNETELLASCYQNAMTLAQNNNIESIAFPAISTGVYGFPIAGATVIAIHEVSKFLKKTPSVKEVLFVCFSQADATIYNKTLNAYGNGR